MDLVYIWYDDRSKILFNSVPLLSAYCLMAQVQANNAVCWQLLFWTLKNAIKNFNP